MGYLEKSRIYKGFYYGDLSKEGLDYLHRRTLEMADEVVGLFHKNGIRYSICGGTLLGAETTGKVIPWDDDFDMCVLDEDYERARRLLLEHGITDAIVQCRETESKYYHGWIKIRDTKSSTGPDKDGYVNTGVWVDMYKLYRIRKSAVDWFVCKEHITYLWRRFRFSDFGIGEFLKRFFRANLLYKTIKSLLPLIVSSSDVYIIGSASKATVADSDVWPLRIYTLEGRCYNGFGNADGYLRNHYGDNYRLLPPEELRRVGINEIRFK